jgi:hypothetical protein
VFETAGFTFLIDKELAAQVGNVKVDMTYYGFVVESENPVSGGESCSCSSAGSCGSAGSGGCGC